MKQNLSLILVILGMLAIAAGIVMPLFTHDISSDWFRYIYSAGALLLLTGRLISPYEGKDLRLKRLYRIEAWAALFFCVAAFMLFYNPYSIRDGLAFTLAGGLIQCYTSIMIPIAARKAK